MDSSLTRGLALLTSTLPHLVVVHDVCFKCKDLVSEHITERTLCLQFCLLNLTDSDRVVMCKYTFPIHYIFALFTPLFFTSLLFPIHSRLYIPLLSLLCPPLLPSFLIHSTLFPSGQYPAPPDLCPPVFVLPPRAGVQEVGSLLSSSGRDTGSGGPSVFWEVN